MIKSIHLQNFFGFQDYPINLEKGENVLVGINGSGKSNLFKAIKLFSEIKERGQGVSKTVIEDFLGVKRIQYSAQKKESTYIKFELDAYDMFNEDYSLFYTIGFIISPDNNDYYLVEKVWKNENGKEIDFLNRNSAQVKLSFDTNSIRDYDSRESCIASIAETYPEIGDVSDIAATISLYDNFDLSKRSEIKIGAPYYKNDSSLLNDGRNLAPVLRKMSLENKSAYNLIIEALKKVNVNFKDIDFDSNQTSIYLLLNEGLESSIHASHISDGTLRFLCLMTILYNPNRGRIVCIDEPELGLHPDMINTLYEAIKHASESSQIIISTHSSQLLDLFELSSVRVFEKNNENATEVKQFNEEKFSAWADDYYPGKMWRAGAIGGNRW